MINKVTTTVWEKLGEEMIRDSYGNINVLVAGYAWEEERGWLLTDTIMLASYNPEDQLVTFLSIPRDLYVNYDNWRAWRINGLYWSHYLEENNSHEAWSKALREKVEEITWVVTPYSFIVNFSGFVDLIDSVDGITIDVPEAIYDTSYPWPNDSYVTFQVEAWDQEFDGERALKYARSRKSTSDFSRAKRQQLIIEWMIDRITELLARGAVGKLNDMLEQSKSAFRTNIVDDELIWLLAEKDKERVYLSYVYTAECDLRYLDFTEPWCVLREWVRDQFGWAAVLIPEWATAWAISTYDATQDFAYRVVHNQNVFAEWAKIIVQNWVDKVQARADGLSSWGVATQLAQQLLLDGFDVIRVENAPQETVVSYLTIPSYGWFPETQSALKTFLPYKEVYEEWKVPGLEEDIAWGDQPAPTSVQLPAEWVEEEPPTLTIVIGNDALPFLTQ